MISAFLGIGGGPLNIAILYYFFSMPPKVIVKNSLFIILFSQAASFMTTIITHTVPPFDILFLCNPRKHIKPVIRQVFFCLFLEKRVSVHYFTAVQK